jgi:hypothetical protein
MIYNWARERQHWANGIVIEEYDRCTHNGWKPSINPDWNNEKMEFRIANFPINKDDINFANMSEFLQWILDGNIFIDCEGEHFLYYKLIDNNLYYSDDVNTPDSQWTMSCKGIPIDYILYAKFVYVNWYHRIPSSGVFCKVSNLDNNCETSRYVVIIRYSKALSLDRKFIDTEGYTWTYAVPATKEELMSKCYDAR